MPGPDWPIFRDGPARALDGAALTASEAEAVAHGTAAALPEATEAG